MLVYQHEMSYRPGLYTSPSHAGLLGRKIYILFNTLSPRQNGHHFADVIFKSIFLNENYCILIEISVKCVPRGTVNNKPSLVQIIAWRRTGDKLLSEPMTAYFTDALYALLGLDEVYSYVMEIIVNCQVGVHRGFIKFQSYNDKHAPSVILIESDHLICKHSRGPPVPSK